MATSRINQRLHKLKNVKKDPSIKTLQKIAESLESHIAILFASGSVHVFNLPKPLATNTPPSSPQEPQPNTPHPPKTIRTPPLPQPKAAPKSHCRHVE